VGGGTQYTEDAVAAGNPTGTAVNLIRADTPATITTTDGDNVSQRGTNYGAAYSQIVTSSGAFVDTFGGGTQYTEGDTDASITGTAAMMEGAANTLLPVQGTVADGLLVNLGANNDVTVTGTVTETNSAAIKTAVETIDNAIAGSEMQVDVITMPTTTVTATDLDVRNLVFATDKVDASGTTLGANSGVDVGDVTINNAAGASAVNIQDGGNTITVDGAVTTSGTVTEANSAAILTSTQLLDDTVKTLGTDTYTEASTKANVIGAIRRDADTTLVDTTNEVAPLQVDANGRLKVEAFSGETLPISGAVTNTVLSVVGGGAEATAQRVTIANDSTGVLSVDDNSASLSVDWNGTQPVTGSGTATGALRVELPTNGTGTVGLNAGTNNIGDVDVLTLPAIPAGTNNIGDVDVLTVNGVAPAFNTGLRGATVQRVTIATDDIVPASQSGTWTVQPGNTANTTAWLVNDQPATTGGLSKFHLVGAATDNATNVKASAGQVYSITAFNLNASPRYLKFHNTAGTPTAGTGVTDTFLIPGNTSGAGVVINIDKGIAFSTGIGISLVTGIADANTTAISASEVVINVYYK
jgi:hypothetical protein